MVGVVCKGSRMRPTTYQTRLCDIGDILNKPIRLSAVLERLWNTTPQDDEAESGHYLCILLK